MLLKQPTDPPPCKDGTQHYTQTLRTAANTVYNHTFSLLCELLVNASQSDFATLKHTFIFYHKKSRYCSKYE